ncbi:ribosome small subunit-dependent GTPase A, partial [bacterium]|nr:ribosome small subunit-dependent GTPase A [bacterium]
IAAGTKGNEQLLACNVDKVFIVSSFNSELNLARLQRYLFLAKKGKIEPIVVLSKLDLEENYQTVAQELAQKLNPVKVMSISCKLNQGIDEIRNEIPPGTTGIFVGSSGVGKSTLVNKLLNREAQATQDVREDDDKGKHTTSSRDLFFLENAGMIVDTAGLREVQVFGDQESLDSTFQDISTLESSCRFSNCTHQEEPGCAIQEGLNSGKIDEDDYKNYQKMLRESAYANRRKDKGVQSNSKKKWKKIHMNMRQRKNFEKKQR